MHDYVGELWSEDLGVRDFFDPASVRSLHQRARVVTL